MPRIRQLTPLVINKIAAGEVIERPCSVLKELLENSIDAGSTRIDIEVENGGSDLIRVVDNGSGIYPEDLPLVFSNHATSKLTEAEDLFSVGTLGFRGEALSSIGGVAQVTLQSRPADLPHGAEISCRGGELSEVRTWNGGAGTRMEVKHLFYNTPVRRKFLRTPGTEMGHICEWFTKLSLAHPALQLTLRHNGKNVYEVPASADLPHRIGLFFGEEIQQKLYPIEAQHGDVRFWGWIADPSVERGNAKLQYLFLNGRWIRDRSLGHALQEAYRGLLMTGRYAIAFLFLDMPPDMVDVNVHPTKVEVRFREGQFLYSMVRGVIRQRLSRENLTPKLQAPSKMPSPQVAFQPMPAKSYSPLPHPPETASVSEYSTTSSPERNQPSTTETNPLLNADHSAEPEPMPSSAQELESAFQSTPAEQTKDPILPGFSQSTDIKAIQLYNAYLILETPEGMLVIDQHALHERILFEQLKTRLREGSLESQSLLIPETIELTTEQAAVTLEHQDQLAELGLQVEDFGGKTVLLQSYPAILGHRPPEKMFKAVVDHLVAKDRLPSREHLVNDILSLMACHAAVRAGDPLTSEQISTLVEQRHLANDAHHCPHGRPTSLLFSRQDLDRQFGRI